MTPLEDLFLVDQAEEEDVFGFQSLGLDDDDAPAAVPASVSRKDLDNQEGDEEDHPHPPQPQQQPPLPPPACPPSPLDEEDVFGFQSHGMDDDLTTSAHHPLQELGLVGLDEDAQLAAAIALSLAPADALSKPGRPVVMDYFERQSSALCGMHCLNNILGGQVFSQASIEAGARRFMKENWQLQDTLDMHVDERMGFYSAEALSMTLAMFGWDSLRPALSSADFFLPGCVGAMQHRPGHWVGLKVTSDGIVLLDSLDEPRLLSNAEVDDLLHKFPITRLVRPQE
eukprot:2762259-Amphidinium_carterae.1